MRASVALLPKDLRPEDVEGKSVVVFDVLRATTSMAAALASGVKEIHVFPDIATAAAARRECCHPALLCGEVDALPPAGFDLGNSPPAFVRQVCEGRTAFVSTTNGTKAILASRGAGAIYIGALVNAAATAAAVIRARRNVTLLCAGTNGQVAMEDLIGCGAVLQELHDRTAVIEENDTAIIARKLFLASRGNLPQVLRESRGGRNVMGVKLDADIDFAARLNSIDVVGRVKGDPPVIVREEYEVV